MSGASDGRSTRAKAQRELRRAEILHAAQREFGTRGYHNTSINDVIVAAGISRGTFYLYFDSKDALFHELIDGYTHKMMDAIEVIDPESPEATRQMLTNIRSIVGLLFDHRDLTILLLREAVGLDADVDRKLNELYSFLNQMVQGALRNGAEWGIIRKVNERIVATALIGSIKEVLYQYLVVDRVDIPDRDAVAQALFDFGLRGLLPNS